MATTITTRVFADMLQMSEGELLTHLSKGDTLCGINIPRPIAGKGVRKFSLVAVMAFIEEIKAAGYPVALYHTHRSTL